MPALKILAGPGAAETIRRDGFDPNRIKVILGASGGPKWLGLYRLDRAILGHFEQAWAGRTDPVHLVGSSIGTWRLAAYALPDPVRALDRLWSAYKRFAWTKGTRPKETRSASRDLLDRLLLDTGPDAILSHPFLRLSIVCARARHLGCFNSRLAQMPFFSAAWLANRMSRKALGAFFERAVFADPRGPDLTGWDTLPTKVRPLTRLNLPDALLQSCAIPLLLDGGPVGGHKGCYRDGGILDYHFDSVFVPPGDDGVIFYPHFGPVVVPGWLDKTLPGRKARRAVKDRMLLICPDPAWVAGTRLGHLPDRHDFLRLDNAERQALWKDFVSASERLADDYRALIAGETLADRIEALV